MKRTKNPSPKWVTDLNREFSTDESQMTERHPNKCSIREMQIKTTLRFHIIPVRMAKIKNNDDNYVRENVK